VKEVFSNRKPYVYLSGFVLAVHYSLVAYINSSLLSRFAENEVLNLLYIAGSILSIVLLYLAPGVLKKYGSTPVFISFALLQIIAIFGMGSATLGILVMLLFILHHAIEPILYLCLDLNMEHETKAEGTTGRTRGVLFTVQNIAWVAAPMLLALLIKGESFSRVYFLSGIALIVLVLIVKKFLVNIRSASPRSSNIREALRSLKVDGDQRRIVIVQFVLQFFYAWMVIYMPLLLNQEIGLSWKDIGIVFTFMLLPFALLQFPAGAVSDRKLGEKELLTIGLVIMLLSTALIPSIGSASLLLWAAVLFATRVGASIVEIESESYFFKHVKEEDSAVISLFRMMRPISFAVAPLFAIIIFQFLSYSSSFYFLVAFLILGLLSIPKVDTK
jgi:MFS family permease